MTNEEQIAYDMAVENHERAMARVAELEREVAALKAQPSGVDERAAFEAAVPLCEMLQQDVSWSDASGRYVLAGHLEMMPAVERRNADWQLWQQARGWR